MIKQNIEKTRLQEKSTIINKDYKKCIEEQNNKFDIIFIDPPYKKNIGVDAITRILNKNLLEKGGIIILETDEEKREIEELENVKQLEIYDRRKYGRVILLFLRERG